MPLENKSDTYMVYHRDRLLSEVTFLESGIRVRGVDEYGAALTQEFINDKIKGRFDRPISNKRLRCRTRKRYIKLLMSEGMSKYGATVWAGFMVTATKAGVIKGYQDAWLRYLRGNITIRPKEESEEKTDDIT